jgi:hypothetical protein
MSVFQPLYFSGGRYTAGTDRKLLAAIFGADSAGDRIVGVIPSNIGTDSLKVSLVSGLDFTIATGMCLIADQSAQANESPGLYLAGVDTNTESITLSARDGNTNYDVIYAQVNEQAFTVTNKALTGDVATLTTSSEHGFLANQTVVISGVDDIFDGTYVIATIPTTTTFTYNKTNATIASTSVVPTAGAYDGANYVIKTVTNRVLTSSVATLTATAHGFDAGSVVTVKGVGPSFDGSYVVSAVTTDTFSYNVNKSTPNVSTAAITTSSVAVARVPFAIKKIRRATAGASFPEGITAIELAEITVPPTSPGDAISIKDLRRFVPTSGGMHVYNSTSGAAVPGASNPTSGMLRYDVSNNKLEVYDSTASGFKVLYANSGADEVFPRLGGTATTAATGNHNHNSVYALNLTTGARAASGTNVTISSESSTAATTIESVAITIPSGASESVLIIANASFTITGSGQTTTMGIYVGSSTTINSSMIIDDTDGTFAMSTAHLVTLGAGSTTIYLKAYKSSGSGVTAIATVYNLTVVPVKAIT